MPRYSSSLTRSASSPVSLHLSPIPDLPELESINIFLTIIHWFITNAIKPYQVASNIGMTSSRMTGV